MALQDFLDSEVAVAVAATAALASPPVRGVLRRGAVYGLAGLPAGGGGDPPFSPRGGGRGPPTPAAGYGQAAAGGPATTGPRLLRLAARAREEAEDILAEAQSMRRREQS